MAAHTEAVVIACTSEWNTQPVVIMLGVLALVVEFLSLGCDDEITDILIRVRQDDLHVIHGELVAGR